MEHGLAQDTQVVNPMMYLGKVTTISHIERSINGWRRTKKKSSDAITGRFGIGGFWGILPPEEVIEAQIKQLREPTIYPPAEGFIWAREAVAKSHWSQSGGKVKINPEKEALITLGARGALMFAMEVLIRIYGRGSYVIISEPGYGGTYHAVKRAGGIPIAVPCGLGHLYPPGVLEQIQVIRANGGVLAGTVMEKIHNPTGTYHTDDDFMTVGQATHKAGGVFISDEVYNPFVSPGKQSPTALTMFNHREVPILAIRSASKVYADSSDRVGDMAGTSSLIRRCAEEAQGVFNYGVPTVCQRGYATALTKCDYFVRKMAKMVAERGKVLYQGCRQAGWDIGEIAPPDGMFGLVHSHRKLGRARQFCLRMAKDHGVRMWPGEIFARPGSKMSKVLSEMVRLPFVEDEEHMEMTFKALERFGED